MNRIFKWIFSSILILYFGVVLYIYFNQTSIIFSPSPNYHPPPKSFNISQKFIPFGNNDSLHTWYIKNNKRNLTILYFTGNAFNISHRLFHVDVFNQLDINAIMFDYKGFGLSTGFIDGKNSFYESSNLVYNYMIEALDIPADSIIFWGYSLGAPISAELGNLKNPLGFIFESPLININKISAENYPYLPFSFINKYNFSLNDYNDKIQSPVLLIHSLKDEVIPFSHAYSFYESLNIKNKHLIKTEGTHRLSSFDSFPLYFNGIYKFINNITEKVN